MKYSFWTSCCSSEKMHNLWHLFMFFFCMVSDKGRIPVFSHATLRTAHWPKVQPKCPDWDSKQGQQLNGGKTHFCCSDWFGMVQGLFSFSNVDLLSSRKLKFRPFFLWIFLLNVLGKQNFFICKKGRSKAMSSTIFAVCFCNSFVYEPGTIITKLCIFLQTVEWFHTWNVCLVL